MKVKDILKKDFVAEGDTAREITGIAYDSRRIKGGELFVAIKGEKLDGNGFAEDAIQRGAAAIVYHKDSDKLQVTSNELKTNDKDSLLSSDPLLVTGHLSLVTKEVPRYSLLKEKYPGVVWIGVEDPRAAIASIANDFFGRPSEEIAVIGITGTNGKTTTSYLMKAILEKWGKEVGLIGTISYMIKEAVYDAPHTTPESADFQALLREMKGRECSHVVAEVSSHALVQKRVDHTAFRAGIFTNLTRDHLDFHKTMDEYYRAKERLFTELIAKDGHAVINIDDPYGAQLSGRVRELRPDIHVLTYALENREADVRAFDIRSSFKGTSFRIRVGYGEHEFLSPLVGTTNVYNMLSAVCTALALDIPVEITKEGIAMTGLVKGRFEKVDIGQDFLAVVDYAHTEDALERLLMTARRLLEAYRFAEKTERLMKAKRQSFSMPEIKDKGKIITVIGCGGNRDKGKRSKMGEIASKLSDFVIVTSDNPRNEDPKMIIKDIERGIKNDNYIVIPDRNVAISMAVELASSGDIVLVAGKGHEEYQEIQGVRHNFSDRLVLEDAIKRTTSRPAFGGDAAFEGMFPPAPADN